MVVMITNYITMWVVNCRVNYPDCLILNRLNKDKTSIILVVDKQGIMRSSIKEEHKPNDSLGKFGSGKIIPCPLSSQSTDG